MIKTVVKKKLISSKNIIENFWSKSDLKHIEYIRTNLSRYVPDHKLVIFMVSEYLKNNKKSIQPTHYKFLIDNIYKVFKSDNVKINYQGIHITLAWEFKTKRIDYDFLNKISNCKFLFLANEIGCFTLVPKEIINKYPEEYFKKVSIPSTQPSYAEQLKMPDWIEKRDKILKLADYQCELCQSSKKLQVHHKKYRKVNGIRLLAWEYEDHELQCLCAACHLKQHP